MKYAEAIMTANRNWGFSSTLNVWNRTRSDGGAEVVQEAP